MMWLNRDTKCQLQYWYKWRVLSALLLMCAIVVQPVQASITDGITWLSAQQDADGGYADSADIASAFQSTAETLHTFYFLGEAGQSGIADAHHFLETETHRNTENLAHLIIVTANSGGDVTDLVTEVLVHRNIDGGFGELHGYDSTVLDTASVLVALVVAQQPLDQSTTNAVHFLLSQQQADGGWLDGGNESSVYISALAMQTLWHYRTEFIGLSDALVGAKRYLLSSQAASGLWDETFESALALIALINNSNEFSEVEALVNELRSRQLANGSWDGSPYATALALRALASQPIPQPPVSTSGEVTGRVLNTITNQPIAGSSIEVEGFTMPTVSDLSGNFTIKDLEPGVQTIHITVPGYLERVFTRTVVAGNILGLGEIFMSPLPTAAALQGVVTDLQTGLPVEGVLVSLNGSANASVITSVNGNYSLGNLTPGNVSISVSKTGFLMVTTNGTLVAGNSVIFSPSLMPANINEQPTTVPTGTGTLQGRVVNKFTRQAVEGVTIVVTGDASALTQTTADGDYSLPGLSPGDINITLSMMGYLSATATAKVVVDSILTFDPLLTPEDASDPTEGTLVGRVVDLATQNPLSNVIVTISNGTESRTVASASNGSFRTVNLPADNYTVAFDLAGYKRQVFSAVVTGGGQVDLQIVGLEPLSRGVTLYGALTGGENGMPVANATVAIYGTAVGIQTDNDGRYRIEGLDVGLKTLIFSATGYSSQTLLFDFPENGIYQVDRALNQSQLSTLIFTSFGVEQFSYPAYTDVQIQATVVNDSNAAIEASIEYTILDDQNQVVNIVRGSWIDANDQEQRTFRFEPGVTVPLAAIWNTGITEPGAYRLIARVVVGDTMVGPASITLAERISSFSIEPTESIPKLIMMPLPGHSGLGRTEQVTFRVGVVNRSNVDTSFVLNYQLQAPDGQILHSNMQAISLIPEEDSKSIDVEIIPITFSAAGTHPVIVKTLTGTVPDEISGGKVSVAPGIHIQPAQNIAPSTVTPDEDKRIRINIRLEGVELK